MATTTNLGVTKLETQQAQKEATINEAFDAFDAAIGGRLSKSVAGSSNVELTTAEARNAVVELTGALTSSINVDLPSDATKWRNRTLIVYNNTTGSHTLTFRYEGGTGVVVPQGFARLVWHNGTNVHGGPAFSPTTGLTSLPKARAFATGSQSIPNATYTDIALAGEAYDTDTIHDTVTNNARLTCKTAGTYHIDGNVHFDASAVGVRIIALYHNNTTFLTRVVQPPVTGAGLGTQLVASVDFPMAVNDYVTLRCYQDSGGALNSLNTFGGGALSMHMLP